ncbi:MAG: hypothetical protein JWN29_4020 [Acidimicrobiales bacterium]|nr:hypothetical protein [Acidimicrobiales bacterium]
MMGRMLSDVDIEHFHTDGFVAVRGAFPRAVAETCVDHLWPELGVDRDDSATWMRPVIRLNGSGEPPFVASANTPALHQAFDQLVGAGRWQPKLGVGTFPVRFPSEGDPGDAGWHVDASYEVDGAWHLNARSRGRALLLLMLFTDVGPDDAPTRIRVGSHRAARAVLEPAGENGMEFFSACREIVPRTENCEVQLATGKAGDVYLCHPFLVHAATWPHRGSAPRWIAQPALDPVEPFDVSRRGCR